MNGTKVWDQPRDVLVYNLQNCITLSEAYQKAFHEVKVRHWTNNSCNNHLILLLYSISYKKHQKRSNSTSLKCIFSESSILSVNDFPK